MQDCGSWLQPTQSCIRDINGPGLVVQVELSVGSMAFFVHALHVDALQPWMVSSERQLHQYSLLQSHEAVEFGVKH